MGYVSLPDRFHSKVSVDEFTGCWEWVAGRHDARGGYGAYWTDGSMQYAHRVSYEAEHGMVPDGLQIDHLCRNPPCVNPAHLEAVTQGENVRRGSSGRHMAVRTHCGRGHAFSGANLYNMPGRRGCRKCLAENNKKWYNAKKERANNE